MERIERQRKDSWCSSIVSNQSYFDSYVCVCFSSQIIRLLSCVCVCIRSLPLGWGPAVGWIQISKTYKNIQTLISMFKYSINLLALFYRQTRKWRRRFEAVILNSKFVSSTQTHISQIKLLLENKQYASHLTCAVARECREGGPEHSLQRGC